MIYVLDMNTDPTSNIQSTVGILLVKKNFTVHINVFWLLDLYMLLVPSYPHAHSLHSIPYPHIHSLSYASSSSFLNSFQISSFPFVPYYFNTSSFLAGIQFIKRWNRTWLFAIMVTQYTGQSPGLSCHYCRNASWYDSWRFVHSNMYIRVLTVTSLLQNCLVVWRKQWDLVWTTWYIDQVPYRDTLQYIYT